MNQAIQILHDMIDVRHGRGQEARVLIEARNNVVLSMSASYEEAITVAKDLKSEEGENPEYDRALCELIGDLWGMYEVGLGDRAADVSREIGSTWHR